MMISGTPSHGLILHKTDWQTGVEPWHRKPVLKEQADLERVRRTCRRICAWVSKGRGKASWDIKQGRLAQNCFCSECVSLSKIERDRRRRFNLQDCHQYRFLHRVSLCGCYMYELKLSTGQKEYKKLRMVTGSIINISPTGATKVKGGQCKTQTADCRLQTADQG